MNVKDKTVEIISQTLTDVDVDKVLECSDDLGQLELNSLSFIKIIVEMEMEFDIEFEDDSLNFSKFISLDDLCGYVEERKNMIDENAQRP